VEQYEQKPDSWRGFATVSQYTQPSMQEIYHPRLPATLYVMMSSFQNFPYALPQQLCTLNLSTTEGWQLLQLIQCILELCNTCALMMNTTSLFIMIQMESEPSSLVLAGPDLFVKFGVSIRLLMCKPTDFKHHIGM